MLGLRHVAWGLPEKLNWLKSVALILVTIDLTSQYKITSLTWFGTEILSLCGLFSQLTEQIRSIRPSYQFVTSFCLLWPVQILEETLPSVHGSPFLAHNPGTVGTFPVPSDPAGKVSTWVFEEFGIVRSTNTTFYTSPLRSNDTLLSYFIHDWRGGRYIIGRREKWPEKEGRKEKSGRKCKEEWENETLGVGRYWWEGNVMAFL